ncbi:MAG: hypothetical protein SGPRY_002953, partial [Prymnesium sp.]
MGADDEEFEKQLETMPGEPGVGLSVCYRNGRSIKEWCIGSYDWAWLCIRDDFGRRKSLRAPPFFAKDDALPILVSLVMGLQHALAMMGGLITPPTLIANDGCLFNRDKELCDAKAYMISSSLITSGILTIVQVGTSLHSFPRTGDSSCCLRATAGLISVMGTSFTFLPIAREITTGEFGPDGAGGKAGYGKFLGTCLVASLLEIALSFIPPRTLRKMFPPLVTGTCVTLIGAALCGTGMKYWGGGVFCSENTLSRAGPWHIASLTNGNPAAVHWPGNPGPQYCAGDNGDVALSYGDARYVGMGTLVLIVMIIFRTFGSPFIKNCNVILSLFLVYFISMGVSVNDKNFVTSEKIDLADTITFNWATTFPLGFSPEGILPILIGFVVSTVESIGDVGASCDASAIPSVGPDAESRIQGGLLADGVNSFFAALMTSPPNTTFSQNNGVIVMTRCASRAAGLACAFWLIVFGVFGKFAGIITSIPTCVLGGMVIFLFSNVMISGLAILSNVKFDNRNRFILAVSLGIGLGVACQPNMFDPAPSSPAAFYGVDLAHKIGFWPMDN